MSTLTEEQAYLAMRCFLQAYCERGKSDEIAALLGGMQLLEDGRPADPAYASDWDDAVNAVLQNDQNAGVAAAHPSQQGNIFSKIPDDLRDEVFESIVDSNSVRIERIISKGHTSPDPAEAEWYDQDQHEWVIVLQGSASVEFENDGIVELSEGDYINIPARTKHRVVRTSASPETIWLAVWY